MKKSLLITLLFSGIFCHAISQTVKLAAYYDANTSSVKLNWNMVYASSKTGYLLLRSADGVTWSEAARDKLLRNYTNRDIYIFNDRLYLPGKNYYRIKIFDNYNNTIVLSPIVAVNAGVTLKTTIYPPTTQRQTTIKENNTQKQVNTNNRSSNSWIIYPNPARDILKVTYKGSNPIRGVVNVQIQNASGKTVIRFRSASIYKTIEIPISNLPRGTYVIQINVLDEFMMNQGFIKN